MTVGVYQEIEVGDVCLCAKGIPGKVTRIATKNGKTIYYGYSGSGKRWQSICPRLVLKRN